MTISAIKFPSLSVSNSVNSIGFLSNGEINTANVFQARSELTESIVAINTLLSSKLLNKDQRDKLKDAKNYAQLAFNNLGQAIKLAHSDLASANQYLDDGLINIGSSRNIVDNMKIKALDFEFGTARERLVSAHRKTQDSRTN